MSLLPSVTGPVQSVEIYVWIIAELASCLRRISPGICTEEGIDQETADLVLGHRDAL